MSSRKSPDNWAEDMLRLGYGPDAMRFHLAIMSWPDHVTPPIPGDGPLFWHSGLSAVTSAGYAVEIYRHFGYRRSRIRTIDETTDKTAMLVQKEGGHDFVVVDGLYVVDPWLMEIGRYREDAVLGLKEDRKLVWKFYGNPATWKNNATLTRLGLSDKPVLRRSSLP